MIFRLHLSLVLTIVFTLPAVAQEDQAATKSAVPAANQQLTSESLKDLGKIVEQYVEKERAVGAELLVIQHGEVRYHESFGYSDREDQRKWENDTICNIRSMTKPITSAAAQILIDRKLLELDEPVAKYLEGFDNEKSKSISVRQVLTHRSGLPLTNLVGPFQYPNLTEQVAAAGKNGPQFEPGSKFWYSDAGTDVVAALIAKTSGEPVHEFVQREILDPLEMTNTFYGFDAEDKRFSKVASLYIKGAKDWLRYWQPKKAFYPFAWGSQTVYSTTTDYAKFLKMMMNNGLVGDRQLLSRAAVERMLNPVSAMKRLGSDKPFPTGFRDLEVFYGQMMVTHHPIGKEKSKPVVIGHSGSDGTNAWAWPERELMILYFTQSRGGPTALRIERPIDQLIIHRGEKFVQGEVPEKLRPYLGTYVANYENFDNEEFTVRARNGKLVLDVPSQMAFELMAPDENGFWAFALVPEQVQATFDRNGKNEIVGLRLHKAGKVYEVPKKGTDRAKLLADKTIDGITGSPDPKSNKTGIQTSSWEGTLVVNSMDLRLEVNIVEIDGKLTGELTSLDQNNTKLKLADVTMDDGTFRFTIQKAGASFSGKLSEDGKIAEGTFTQQGKSGTLILTRSAKKKTVTPKK